MTDFPPGTIGMLTGDLARYTAAMLAFQNLQVPEGSQRAWVQGHYIPVGVNMILSVMRPEDAWVCLMTDDNPAPPDMLLRLLAHHLPLVAPLVCLRRAPFGPSLFHDRGDRFEPYTWEEVPSPPGLLAVDTFGGPGVVIRREVIEAIGRPFFENMPGPRGREIAYEDLYSFNKVRLAGFQPMVDLDCRIGHVLPMDVTPTFDPEQGRWGVGVHAQMPLGVLWPEDLPVLQE